MTPDQKKVMEAVIRSAEKSVKHIFVGIPDNRIGYSMDWKIVIDVDLFIVALKEEMEK